MIRTASVLLAACALSCGKSHAGNYVSHPEIACQQPTAPTDCPMPAIEYNDVVPVFQQWCVTCHDGHHGEWPLTDFDSVADWGDHIRAQLLGCTMPPTDGGEDMPAAAKEQILGWIRCGMPNDDAS